MAPAAARCQGQGQGTLEINTHYLGQLNLIIVDNASTYMSPELYLRIGYSMYSVYTVRLKLELEN